MQVSCSRPNSYLSTYVEEGTVNELRTLYRYNLYQVPSLLNLWLQSYHNIFLILLKPSTWDENGKLNMGGIDGKVKSDVIVGNFSSRFMSSLNKRFIVKRFSFRYSLPVYCFGTWLQGEKLWKISSSYPVIAYWCQMIYKVLWKMSWTPSLILLCLMSKIHNEQCIARVLFRHYYNII